MKYELCIGIQVKNDYPSNLRYYRVDTIEELKRKVGGLQSNEVILETIHYHLVYEHPIFLPSSNFIQDWSKREIYDGKRTIPKEQIKTVKKKAYQDNYLNEEPYSNFCIKYNYVSYNALYDWFEKVSGTYDLNAHDKENTEKALYQHTKSNQFFNICYYQYRHLSLRELEELIR